MTLGYLSLGYRGLSAGDRVNACHVLRGVSGVLLGSMSLVLVSVVACVSPYALPDRVTLCNLLMCHCHCHSMTCEGVSGAGVSRWVVCHAVWFM